MKVINSKQSILKKIPIHGAWVIFSKDFTIDNMKKTRVYWYVNNFSVD